MSGPPLTEALEIADSATSLTHSWSFHELGAALRVLAAEVAALRADRDALREDLRKCERALSHAARSRDAQAETLRRAVRIAKNLHGMISPEEWRAHGGDDGQGHYEGDYHAEQIRDEIDGWKRALAVPSVDAPEERYVVSDERLAEIESLLDEDHPARGADTYKLAGAVYDLLAERRPVPSVDALTETREFVRSLRNDDGTIDLWYSDGTHLTAKIAVPSEDAPGIVRRHVVGTAPNEYPPTVPSEDATAEAKP